MTWKTDVQIDEKRIIASGLLLYSLILYAAVCCAAQTSTTLLFLIDSNLGFAAARYVLFCL